MENIERTDEMNETVQAEASEAETAVAEVSEAETAAAEASEAETAAAEVSEAETAVAEVSEDETAVAEVSEDETASENLPVEVVEVTEEVPDMAATADNVAVAVMGNNYVAPSYSRSELSSVYGDTGEQLSKEELKAVRKKNRRQFNIDAALAGGMMIIFAIIMNFVGGYINQIVMYFAIPDVVSQVFREGGLSAVENFYYSDYCDSGSQYFALSGITDNIGYCFFVLVYMIPFIIYALCRKVKPRVFTKGNGFSGGFLLVSTAIGMGLIYLWAYAYTVAAELVDVVDLGYIFTLFSESSNAAMATPLGTVFYLIGTCIAAPLGEEFVCRGVMLNSLKKYGNWWAIAITAGLFGLMHMNFYQGPYAFLMGLVLGYVTVKTGSIWCAVLIHMINNSWSCLGEVVAEYLPAASGVMDIISTVVMLALMPAAIILLIVFAAKGKISLPRTDESPLTRVRAKTLRFSLSPLNFLFIAFCLLSCILLILPQ